ncbi:MAG: FAD-dependent oxidoreductase [Verrucomicrobia bacterium]|nr:FAD-dependent oxidoreductase [Verrucomicrobiota bacterium]
MNPRTLVIVGGVAGGMSAAARARRLNEECEIIVFERGPHVSFANCGLPYVVGGEIAHPQDLVLQTPQCLRERFNLDVRVRTEVTAIHRTLRQVRVRDLETGREYDQPYDDLVLSTGASPLRPAIPGIDQPGHFAVRAIPDIEQILPWLHHGATRRAVVVGGGYIGLEMAEQLHRRGLAVTLVEALPQVMAPLDPEMAAWLHHELRAHDVTLYLDDPVAAFEKPAAHTAADGAPRASVVVLRSGHRLPADVVVLGLGVSPETRLAQSAGLLLGKLGGIRVNDRLQTSDPHIWAVGDVIEVRDAVTGQWSLVPLAGPANRQGRIVADNLLGGTSRYAGTWGTAVLRLFSLTAACTGANEKALRLADRPCEVIHMHPGSHAGYYPGAQPIALKILFAPHSGKLLGAQAVGRDGVDKRIDVLATALRAGMTVRDLAELELAYAPPFGSAKDPVNLAGMAASNVLDGLAQTVQWHEISALDLRTTLLLDVRSDEERQEGALPNSMHIPLPQLRARVGELPKDRDLVVYCQSGQRSYFASRFLQQKGFRARNLTGSYLTWKTAVI